MTSDMWLGNFCQGLNGEIVRTLDWVSESPLSDCRVEASEHAPMNIPKDHRLPYCFDMIWDVRRRSQLVTLLAQGTEDTELRRAMEQHGIVLSDSENAELHSRRWRSPEPYPLV